MAINKIQILFSCFHVLKVWIFASVFIMPILALTSCESNLDPQSRSSGGPSSQTSLSRNSENALTLPPEASEGGQTTPRQKLEGLQGLKGVNVDQMFSRTIRDTDRRFDRLENAVVEFRREFEAVKPEIIRLIAIEKDIQTLIDMMSQDLDIPPTSPEFTNDPIPLQDEETVAQPTPQESRSLSPESDIIDEETPIPPAPPSAEQNAIEDAPPNPEVPPPPASQASVQPSVATPAPAPVTSNTGALNLTNFRYGDHADYTRLVIDGTAKTSYRAELDPSGEILTVTIPDAAWTAAQTQSFDAHPLLQSYNAQKDQQSGGTVLYVSFKKPVTLINQGGLSGNSAPRYRIFIDVR